MTRWTLVLAAVSAVLATASPAMAANRLIHLGGNCSTGWANSYFTYGDYLPESANIDQRYHHDDAVAEFRDLLDARCVGQDNCIIYAFSNGGAVTSETLATYDPSGSRWNITMVMTTGSNEGGSELSDLADIPIIGDIGQFFTCGMSDEIGPSAHRNGWNHHVTGGTTIYGVAGWDRVCVFGWCTSSHPFITGRHDSVVGYHSAYMQVSVNNSTSAWSQAQWSSHVVAGTSSGIRVAHSGMPDRGFRCMTGGGC